MVSPVSGCVYERRLIEKYISENGTDPMNGEKLAMEMMIDVKSKYAACLTEVYERFYHLFQ